MVVAPESIIRDCSNGLSEALKSCEKGNISEWANKLAPVDFSRTFSLLLRCSIYALKELISVAFCSSCWMITWACL